MLSSRGSFIAIGGILLLSVGLSAKGIGTVATMIPILFEGFEGVPSPSNGQNGASQNATDPLFAFLEVFDILNKSPIVDYGMFLGTMLLLASVLGLPFFR
ncbi:MAG: hypothetical protein ACXACR_08245, partial [Candidatus Hodarchaeales archaeon]